MRSKRASTSGVGLCSSSLGWVLSLFMAVQSQWGWVVGLGVVAATSGHYRGSRSRASVPVQTRWKGRVVSEWDETVIPFLRFVDESGGLRADAAHGDAWAPVRAWAKENGHDIELLTRRRRTLEEDGILRMDALDQATFNKPDAQYVRSLDLTAEGLRMAEIWPSDGRELVERVAQALEVLADSGTLTPEQSTEAKTTGNFISSLAANIGSTIIMGA